MTTGELHAIKGNLDREPEHGDEDDEKVWHEVTMDTVVIAAASLACASSGHDQLDGRFRAALRAIKLILLEEDVEIRTEDWDD